MGVVAKSDAQVIHLHDLSRSYDLKALFQTRKMLSRTYAKILMFQGFQSNLEDYSSLSALRWLYCLSYPTCSGVALSLQFLFSLANLAYVYY